MIRLLAGMATRLFDGNTTSRQLSNRQYLLWTVVVAALGSFLGLLTLVRSNHRMNVDVQVTLKLQGQNHPTLEKSMGIVSWLGFRPQSLIFPATMILSTWSLGFKRDARFLLFAWLASLANFTTKQLVQRPRPSGDGILVTKADLRDSSFPSGHVMHYLVFWGFFAYLLSRRLPAGPLRWLPVSALCGMISAIGPSRIYLGHHWLTDVLGSYSLGTGFLLTLIGLHRREEQ